jgi:branched-chain amino acid transport system permease protein
LSTEEKLRDLLSSRQNQVLILLIALLLIPAVTRDYYILTILIFANIFAVYGASWDILAGFTGIFSFGQAFFFGGAGYISALLNVKAGLPVWISIPLGGACGVLVGLLFGLPSLRLKGPYFTIMSLVFPTTVVGIIYMFPWLSGGEAGIYGLDPISGDIAVTYVASVVLMLGSIFALMRIASSRFGLIFRSIRDNTEIAETTGINTTKYKFLSFGISGLFAGLAGAFQAHLLMSISPFIFNPSYSLSAMLYASLGGIGTILGSVGGAFIMSILNEALRGAAEFRLLIYAVVMVLVFRFLPEGLLRRIGMRFSFRLGVWGEVKKLRRRRGKDGTTP